MLANLQYISSGNSAKEQTVSINAALDAGCAWIQLRIKDQPKSMVRKLARDIKKKCEAYQATFIVNDDAEIAKEVDADGVHLGLQDSSVQAARILLGDKKVIGGTANTLEDVLRRIEEGCDYIGLGPLRFTATKKNLSPIIGLEGCAHVANYLKEKGLYIPIYVIGGVILSDIPQLAELDLHGAALSTGFNQASDKKDLITKIKEIYGNVKNR